MNYIPNGRLKKEAIAAALESYRKHKSIAKNKKHIVVVDFNQHSSKKRLYLYDLEKNKVVRMHHCAHGVKSNDRRDKSIARYFSNAVGSRKSSLGAMVTGNVYTWGKRFPTRRKLKLKGLEPGVNSNVFVRAIVVHSSNYVRNSYIDRMGRTGNSWGCFAVDPAICDSLIDIIKDGTFLYAHSNYR